MVKLAVLAAFLGLVVAVSIAPRSEAAFPGTNGLIAYDADGSLCVMGPDGSNPRRLTYSTSYDLTPAWSPEGARLAFTRIRAGLNESNTPYEIHVLKGGRVQNVSSDRYKRDTDPAWSPDGRQLAGAFNEVHFGGVPFFVMNADGSARREVVPGDSPAWSPDGQWIAYYSDVSTKLGPEGLYLIRHDGSGKRRLASGYVASWSPDGNWIAFVTGRGIFTISPGGTGMRQLTNEGSDSGPEWSPDGRLIAFTRSSSIHDLDIWVMTPEGAGLRNLTGTPSVREGNPSWRSREGAYPLPRGARGCGQKIGDSDVDPPTASELDGGPLDDLIYARGDDDRVRGLGGNDILFGGSGNDRVLGGSGEDTIVGGHGNDVVGARDGVVDQITCGPGRDRAVVDTRDRVARDCERISRR